MEEALLASWLVPPGQPFAIGDVLYEVETEKVTTGVEATVAGSLVRVLVAQDDRVEVGAVLGVIAEPGEQPSEAEIDAFLSGAIAAPAAAAPVAASASAVTEAVPAGPDVPAGPVRAMPRTRALARELNVPLEVLAASRPGDLITEDDVRSAAAASVATSPTAALTPGSAPAATLVAAAVSEPSPLSAPTAIPAPTPAPAPEPTPGVEVRERRRLGAVARRMADVTARSWTTVPQFSQSIEIDTSNWAERREAMRTATALPVGYTDLIVSGVVRAIQDVPEVNSSFGGDELVIYRDVNLSLAVDTPDGLQVPVLHRLQELSDAGRARLLRDRAEKARTGRLGLDDVQGGTITLSNLGMFGVEGGMPMVTAPQACIVFVGAVVRKVVPVGEGIAVRPMCTVVISYDHRALDGATAARFTAAIRRHLQGGQS
jgi:pyruvate dehydrogenase E2 component (dihydrolipoamide acetyltransferase)